MSTITTRDGTTIYYKDWGSGPAITFSHGWPLNSDMWDAQMLFLANQGFRVVAHDRRGHGRSSQATSGNDMNGYADDLAALIEALDLEGITMVGHSTGGGEVARYGCHYRGRRGHGCDVDARKLRDRGIGRELRDRCSRQWGDRGHHPHDFGGRGRNEHARCDGRGWRHRPVRRQRHGAAVDRGERAAAGRGWRRRQQQWGRWWRWFHRPDDAVRAGPARTACAAPSGGACRLNP